MGAINPLLSLNERRRIEDWWHAKVPARKVARVLPGKYVDSYDFPGDRLEFRWKCVSHLYSAFDT